jgi:uncharacterized protein
MMTFLCAAALILVLLGCWCITLLGIPGNWLMVAATAIYAWLVPTQSPASLGWKTVVALLALVLAGSFTHAMQSA